MNTPELFPVTQSLSPRLLWLRTHNLILEETGCNVESPETGDDIPVWVCRKDKGDSSCYKENEIGGGETAEDAIADFCQNSGTKHYSLS